MQTQIFQKPGICASGARLGQRPSRDPSVSCVASSPSRGASVGTNSPGLSRPFTLYRPSSVSAIAATASPWGKLFLRNGAVAKFFFAAALLLHPAPSISRPRLPVTAQIFILGHSKADRGIFPGLPVDNFLCSTTTQLFSQNNGFPACFFAASSTAS